VGLTSLPFLVALSVAAAATVVAAAWAWPRVAGSRPRHLAGRAGVLAVTELMVVAAVLGWLNAYFTFYGAWSDLLGPPRPQRPAQEHSAAAWAAPPQPIVVTKRIAARSVPPRPSASARPAAPAPGDRKDGGAARSGEILAVRITGLRTGIKVAQSYVYLPPQYFQSAYSRHLFPVVLYLTGYPGDPWSAVARLNIPGTAGAEMNAGTIQPAVFVMMPSSVTMPRDTECTDIPGGPQAATFFAVDMPLAMEQEFRVTAGASGWSVMGDSTGGYCAVKLAMTHSDRFSAAVSLAGYYDALADFTTGDLYGGSPAYRRENDLFWRLQHLPPPPVSVLLASSRVGETDYQQTLRFLEMVRPPMRGYSLILSEGGHNFRTWSQELRQALRWLSDRQAPGPAGPP
jgi:S-formylglutathione hydrolase FrmB